MKEVEEMANENSNLAVVSDLKIVEICNQKMHWSLVTGLSGVPGVE